MGVAALRAMGKLGLPASRGREDPSRHGRDGVVVLEAFQSYRSPARRRSHRMRSWGNHDGTKGKGEGEGEGEGIVGDQGF